MKRPLGLALLALVLFLPACAYDNFEPPESLLEGTVVYEGEPVGVRQRGVNFELWEPGYQLDGFINVNIFQDGTFTSKLFDGRYKLVRKEGPWVTNTDTIDVEVNGNQAIEVPVTPYFVLRNTNVARSGTTVSATFDVEQVVGDAELEYVALYVNDRQFVDNTGQGNAANTTVAAADLASRSGVALSVEIPGSLQGQPAVFARIGVKTVNTPELLYSQVQKLEQ